MGLLLRIAGLGERNELLQVMSMMITLAAFRVVSKKHDIVR